MCAKAAVRSDEVTLTRMHDPPPEQLRKEPIALEALPAKIV